ncbi:MAG: type IV pilus twitching motility protein PilT [Chthoniobacterales bacterium]
MDRKIADDLLAAMVQQGEDVSDLLFMEGKPPLVDIHGRLHPFPIGSPQSATTPELIEELSSYIINGNPRLMSMFQVSGSCDCSYTVENVARFRANIYKQNGRRAIVMRKFPSKIPTLDELGLPPVFREIITENNGIVLITGAAGTGKTTTLAAVVNEINRTRDIHILTLEDPIEFVHPHGRAAISQRELGTDFPSFADGLRVALRQAPKVILVGEIRDRETMEIAMTASETGHLVLSTLHTVHAGQTINRVLGFFDRSEEEQIRQRLAQTVRFIVTQRLVDKIGGGRLLVTEVLGNNLRTREAIVYGESEGKTFHEIIEAGSTRGWQSFDQCLLKAREADLISDETVMLYCTHKAKTSQQLELLRKRRGIVETQVSSGLKLDIVQPIRVRDESNDPTRSMAKTGTPG